MIRHYCILLICTAWLGLPGDAAWPQLGQDAPVLEESKQDEDSAANADPFMAALFMEVRNELKTLFSVDLGMELEGQRQFFELDQATVEALELKSKSLVDSHVELFSDDVIQESWQRIGAAVQKGTTFKVNGRECVLEGEERQVGGPAIAMCIYRKSVLFTISYGGGKTTTMLGDRTQFEPTSSNEWKETLSHLTVEDLDRYKQYQLDYRKKKVVELLMASLTLQLRLSEEQVDPVREWILNSVELNLEQTGIISGAKRALGQLAENELECLTESQRTILRMIKAKGGR